MEETIEMCHGIIVNRLLENEKEVHEVQFFLKTLKSQLNDYLSKANLESEFKNLKLKGLKEIYNNYTEKININ
jgi:hypothetical protein